LQGPANYCVWEYNVGFMDFTHHCVHIRLPSAFFHWDEYFQCSLNLGEALMKATLCFTLSLVLYVSLARKKYVFSVPQCHVDDTEETDSYIIN